MKAVVIKSESDYNSAANRIEVLTKANPGTAEAQELKVLVKAVVNFHRTNKQN
jgi:PHD/YefM family antitoxin component YafN of YafNO toxin-antitoxin module